MEDSRAKEGIDEPLDGAVAFRRETQSLFLFKDESEEEVAARLANQKLADQMANDEQARRVGEQRDVDIESEIVRQINVEYSIRMEEEEQARRVREYELAKVQDQLLRQQRQQEAIKATEEERQRRLSEMQAADLQDQHDRQRNKWNADQAMEHERVRRLSSTEHLRRMSSGREVFRPCVGQDPVSAAEDELFMETTESSEQVDAMDEQKQEEITSQLRTERVVSAEAEANEVADAFADIPVVHASHSKILLDQNTEWQGYILSDNTEEETKALHALRQSLEDDLKKCPQFVELVGDVRLLRFLRGHKMNISQAAAKYREMLEVRMKLGLDAIRENIRTKNLGVDELPAFNKIIRFLPFLQVHDLLDAQDSNMFYFEKTGFTDIHSLVTQLNQNEFTEFFHYQMEFLAMKLDALSRQQEKLVRCVFVRDLDGFRIAHFHPLVLKWLQPVVVTATKCYPETMHRTLLLNMPWVCHKLWQMVVSWLHQNTLSKICMDNAECYELLLSMLLREQIPKSFGGKSVTHAVPQTGFLGKNTFGMLCEEGAEKAELRAGGVLQLPFRVQANDTLCWEYEVQSHDIDFSVKFRTQGDGGACEEDKVPKSRVQAGKTILGSFTALTDGTLVLSWDNSFSWTRSKVVAYKAQVVKATHDFASLSGNDCV